MKLGHTGWRQQITEKIVLSTYSNTGFRHRSLSSMFPLPDFDNLWYACAALLVSVCVFKKCNLWQPNWQPNWYIHSKQDWILLWPPPPPLCRNYTGSRYFFYVANIKKKNAFLISICKWIKRKIICLENVLLCYLRVYHVKLKQHQLFILYVWIQHFRSLLFYQLCLSV